jgi:ubiquinone/menaquinone biosynthesis C-methylase UbiE
MWPKLGQSANAGLLLDIGCGWGRWMVAAGREGFRPVGVDVKLEPLQASRRVMRTHGIAGHLVVADLAALPFRDGTFDCVFSYSVIQHAHKQKAASCLADIRRVLKDEGACLVELPLKYGLTNIRHLLKSNHEQNDQKSWVVRYYTPRELKQLFGRVFGNLQLSCDCFCGIGVRLEDIDLLPWRYKPIVIASTVLRWVTRVCPPFVRFSDSVFIEARKYAGTSRAV